MVIRWQDSMAKKCGFEAFWNGMFWGENPVEVGEMGCVDALRAAAPGVVEFRDDTGWIWTQRV